MKDDVIDSLGFRKIDLIYDVRDFGGYLKGSIPPW
jgi:hypothetical protein